MLVYILIRVMKNNGNECSCYCEIKLCSNFGFNFMIKSSDLQKNQYQFFLFYETKYIPKSIKLVTFKFKLLLIGERGLVQFSKQYQSEKQKKFTPFSSTTKKRIFLIFVKAVARKRLVTWIDETIYLNMISKTNYDD